jgi:hemerythrin superfamily protein
MASSTDALVLLREDHRAIRKLFKEFQSTGDRAVRRRGELVSKILEELTVHTYVENEVVYPRVRALMPELKDDILESYEEHHVADVLAAELVSMQADDERFVAKTTVLIENVTHHIDEEENEWFPAVRAGLSRTQLREIGAEMLRAKESAPRHPAQPGALQKAARALLG